MLRQNKISSSLIALSSLLIVLMLILLWMNYRTNRAVRNDAHLINSAGVIRGSIQRQVKLEIEGCSHVCDEIEATINSKLAELKQSSDELTLTKKLDKLTVIWGNLLQLLKTHRTTPSPQLQREILQLSEYAWETADSAVFLKQLNTESKMLYLKLYYPIAFLILFLNLLAICVAYTRVGKKLEHLVSIDSLTGIYNRRSFLQCLEQEKSNARLAGSEFALIYFDIDHFKSVNDQHGHQTGDLTLKEIARLVKSSIRQSDGFARIGGEEFAVVAPHTDRESAILLAEKIRKSIANHSFPPVKTVTVSVGVTSFKEPTSLEKMVGFADKALYKAKQLGRNRVIYLPVAKVSKMPGTDNSTD